MCDNKIEKVITEEIGEYKYKDNLEYRIKIFIEMLECDDDYINYRNDYEYICIQMDLEFDDIERDILFKVADKMGYSVRRIENWECIKRNE